MNFNLLSHLIMAHLLSGTSGYRWWVNSMESTEDVYDSETNDELCADKSREMENYAVKNNGYLKYVQWIKIHDWIIDVEKEFPDWLSHLEVDRLIKWVLAIKFVEGPIFDDLRNCFKKCNQLRLEEFANEIDPMFEVTTTLFAGKMSGVPKPKQYEIPQVCELIFGENAARKAACNILLSAISDDKTNVPTSSADISSSTADTYLAKFYVIIAECKKLHNDAKIRFKDVLKKVESNSEFINHNCTILESFLVNRSEIYDSTEYAQKRNTNLPAIVIQIRVGFPINLQGVSTEEFEENYSNLESLMNAIKTDLEELLRVERFGGNFFTPVEFIPIS
ncbi:uncharacterized protein LOC135845458 [Planococcus citri]|uniref:uncharacterized protein LOC135845458 n=1 Tax=Planococcus citri TaxID=170843 RepID=UPI0031F79A61